MLKKIIFTNVLFFFSAIIIESIYSNSFEDIRNLLGVSDNIESLKFFSNTKTSVI